MLTTVEGVYRDGQIEWKEPLVEIQNETPVIVTFLVQNGIDLRAQGIGEVEAAELRAALSTFVDWGEPEMSIYDNYDAAKSNS